MERNPKIIQMKEMNYLVKTHFHHHKTSIQV